MKLFTPYFRLTITVITAIVICSFMTTDTFAQTDSQKVVKPKAPQPNAGFDVIIKTNGEIVYGLVKEVGPYFISYQRTDIPDGPIYTIPRNEVYAISYRNQVKDYITPVMPPPEYGNAYHNYYDHYKKQDSLFKHGIVRLQLGFLRSFTKVNDVKSYSSNGSVPVVSAAYEIIYKNNINLGVQIGFGSRKFSKQEFSSYDSTQTAVNLKENIFGLYVYGRYYFLNNLSVIQPFIAAGIGVTSSNVISNNKISFTNDNSQVILVKSGQRATGIGFMARVGAEYFLNEQFQVTLDAGYGLSVINAGIAVTL